MTESMVSETVAKAKIIAFDPGRNVGVAYVDFEGTLLHGEIVDLGAVKRLEYPPHARIIIGDGTGSRAIQDVFIKLGLEFRVVDEKGTTLAAKDLYFKDHPPTGWMRFLPPGLWSPPRNIDEYAAYAIGLRFLKNSKIEKFEN